MPVFTVHMPFVGAGQKGAADQSVFVRDGFHFWAFVFGPLWMLWHRLWLAAIVYLVVIVGLEFALSHLHVDRGTRWLVMAIIAFLVGFEATSLWRWARSRGRWREVGVVVASNRENAERRFFDHWTGETAERAEPAAFRGTATTTPAPHGDIIGLFPRPGGQS